MCMERKALSKLLKWKDKKNRKGKKGDKPKKPVWKKLLLTILVILVVLVGGICAMVWSLTDTFDRQKTNPEDFAISEKAAKELKGYRNIAILGTDSRADESYDVSRTDAIIVLSFKKSSGDLRMISVMRRLMAATGTVRPSSAMALMVESELNRKCGFIWD